MPKGNGTKNCIKLSLINGVLKEGYRGLMAGDMVERSAENAVARLKAGGSLYLEDRGSNLEDVKRMMGDGSSDNGTV